MPPAAKRGRAWSGAHALDEAQRSGTAIDQLDSHHLTAPIASRQEVLARRLARGERLVGCKLGSRAGQDGADGRLGDHRRRLTDAMRVPDGADVDLVPSSTRDRAGDRLPARPCRRRVMSPILLDAVAPSSRSSTRATSTSGSASRTYRRSTSAAAFFVVGEWQPVPDVRRLAVRLVVMASSRGRSTRGDLGHPLRALEELVGLSREYDIALHRRRRGSWPVPRRGVPFGANPGGGQRLARARDAVRRGVDMNVTAARPLPAGKRVGDQVYVSGTSARGGQTIAGASSTTRTNRPRLSARRPAGRAGQHRRSGGAWAGADLADLVQSPLNW